MDDGSGLENRRTTSPVGSNPTSAACGNFACWRDGRVAEGARLLSECTGLTCTVGSNPTLSAKDGFENILVFDWNFRMLPVLFSLICARGSIG